MVLDANGFEILGQNFLWKTGLLLIEIDRDQFEIDRRDSLQVAQQVKQGVAVRATRKAHHDAIASFDHVEIADRTTSLIA